VEALKIGAKAAEVRTEAQRLIKKAADIGVETWNGHQLIEFIEGLPDPQQRPSI
jgi:hypothetical protein